MLVEGSSDGTTWTTVENINNLPTTGTTKTYNNVSGYNRFRFTYTKSSGNLAFDDVYVNYSTTTPSFVTGYNDLSVSGTSQSVTGLTANTTYYYRVRATSTNSTSANSNVVTVVTTPVAPTGSSSQSFCDGATVADLAATGSNIKWYATSSGGSSLASTTALVDATHYYATQTINGVESADRFDVTVTIYPTSVAGSISGAGTVCTGTNSTTLTLSGFTGTIQWQSSANNSTFNNISGATGFNYTAANLTSTTYFRAVVTSGVCSSATTSSVTVTVNPASVSGSISGAGTVCTGTNSTTLTLSGNTGTIQWQSSSDNSNYANISGSTGSTYTATDLTATTYYRAVVTSGVCSSATSGSTSITINPLPTQYSVTGGGSYCSGGSGFAIGLNNSESNVSYQLFMGSTAIGSPVSGTDAAISFGTFTTAGTYTVKATNANSCTSDMLGSAIITVKPIPDAPTITTTQPDCGTSTTGSISISTPNGAGYTYSIDNTDYSNTSGTFNTLTPASYPVTARLDGCTSAITTATIAAALNTWTGNFQYGLEQCRKLAMWCCTGWARQCDHTRGIYYASSNRYDCCE